MARVSVQELKANLGVTDKQLDLACSDDHLKKLADEIEDYHQYGYALGLKGWQLTEINTDPSLTYVMKTQAVLKRWKENDPYKATYLNLLKVVLDLSEGVLAVKLCELCKERREDDSSSLPTAASEPPRVLSDRQQGILKDLKDHTGLTDDELSKEITESHLNKIADLIDNYEQFAEAFQLKPWRVTEIKADPNLNYIMKTQAVLKQWRQDHPFKATYLNLVLVALELSEGTLATKICEYCKEHKLECDSVSAKTVEHMNR